MNVDNDISKISLLGMSKHLRLVFGTKLLKLKVKEIGRQERRILAFAYH